ncbi:hypothetical protein C789_1688 [Microcystis aeruginosa FACHB-905 = DIANCHI905]|uniref:Uncharacterized protein n=1 Tax=Microcystis aeruginosa PCC 7806SL TaxID=1903187 RepID=A0AB33BVD7_MICA7|nr:hypothetical protein BH695_3369 [Microcystis aeruginosa PCC 7806SL]ELS48520.1 hypothetical protein C789_1688 [Microcystis aeruginosa FACHB-905 = DIANCHI905]
MGYNFWRCLLDILVQMLKLSLPAPSPPSPVSPYRLLFTDH